MKARFDRKTALDAAREVIAVLKPPSGDGRLIVADNEVTPMVSLRVVTIERVYKGDAEIQAWLEEERERQRVCPIAWGCHVPLPAGKQHWQMTSERTVKRHNDLAEARRNGAPLPEKTSPPLPPATGSLS